MTTAPLVVAIDMGYGHLRAAVPLAERLGVELLHADQPPAADEREQRWWRQARERYEAVCRWSQADWWGAPFRLALERLTHIAPLYPLRDESAPNATVKFLGYMANRGLGKPLAEWLRATGAPLLTTFYTPAVLAAHHGCERVFCVVTDSDVHRIWAPIAPQRDRVRYFAPSDEVVRRLRSYGVPAEDIELTGFPLPHELLGGPELPALKRNLAARLARLDRRGRLRARFGDDLLRLLGPLPEAHGPVRLTFAIGGAGAQVGLAMRFLPTLFDRIRRGELALTLVAGVRDEVRARLAAAVHHAGLAGDVDILYAPTHDDYFRLFHAQLASTDILWTKPSEMVFFGALGLPLLLAPAIGVHEEHNADWARRLGVALPQAAPEAAGDWITDWLDDGQWAEAAWSGFLRMPQQGLYRILDRVRS